MTHEPECLSDEFASWKIEECICDRLRACEQRIRDDEARAAADRVEALPWLNDGRTVNRNQAILAARRNLRRQP